MFSRPLSEVYVVFHKSVICVFAQKNCLISKQEKYVSLSGGETLFCLFIGNIQQEVTVSTTTTTLHIYYYLFHYKFTTYYLWPWKSRLGFNYQDIILKKVLLSQTSNTTATTLNSYAILLTTRNQGLPYSFFRCHCSYTTNHSTTNNSPGMEKHLDRGFLLNISRYNSKKAK